MLEAIGLSEWFIHEVRRVYAILRGNHVDAEQNSLADWILRRGGEATPRELVRNLHRYRGDTNAAEEALNGLVEIGWGSWQTRRTGGRPKRVFVSNQCTDKSTEDVAENDLLSVSVAAAVEEPVKTQDSLVEVDGWPEDLPKPVLRDHGREEVLL